MWSDTERADSALAQPPQETPVSSLHSMNTKATNPISATQVVRAQSMQVRATGRASSLPSPIALPQVSQAP
jgi:hypothetical protein